MGVGSQQTYDTNTDATPDAEGEWTVMDGTDSVTEWDEVLEADSICVYNENKDGENVQNVLDAQANGGLVGIYVDAEQWANYQIDSMTTADNCTTFMVTMNEHREPDMPEDLPASGDVDFQFAIAPPGEGGMGSEEIVIAVQADVTPADPDNTWGYASPEDGWENNLDDTDYSTTFPLIYASQRRVVGAPSAGDAITDEWSQVYLRNAAPLTEELTLGSILNLQIAAGDSFAIITFDRPSGDMFASDIYIRGSRIRIREDGETDEDWVEIESGDGNAFTPYILTGIDNGTTYNVEVTFVYRYPPTYVLVLGTPVIKNVTPEESSDEIIAQYSFDAGAGI